ncbi:MAG TPA: alpha/beta fold hydrolase [Vicinamibacterales bacterium]
MSSRFHPALAVAFVLATAPLATAQAPAAKTIAPGPSLVVEGVPAIPASLADEVRRYTETRAASLADWHPTKRELLISTRFGNTAQLHHVRTPGGARTQLTFFDEPVGGASYEPKAGRYFVFARDEGGNEFAQLYRYDLEDGRVTLLTDGGRSQNGGVVLNTAGDRIAYVSTRRNGADRDVYVADPLKPGSDRLLLEVSGGGWRVLDWSPDDRQIVVLEYKSITKSDLYLVDVASGKRAPLTDPATTRPGGTGPAIAYGDAEFTADGRSLIVTTDDGSEFLRLARLDLATKKLTPLVADIKWDVEEFDVSEDGRRVAYVVNEAGRSTLHLLDLASGRSQPVKDVPAGVIDSLEWHRNSVDLGFTVASARSVSDVYSLNADDGTITRWTESELGGLVPSQLSEPELITWKSFDGLEVSGFYYRPPSKFTGRRPVIINIHGGPEGQARPAFLGRNNYFLNELGVALIYPNVRGSSGYGRTFVSLDNRMKREDSVKDIGALLDWIGARPELDASKVMVMGGSYGGYMTLAVATNYNDRVACALDVVGISHFATFLQNTESYRRDLRRVEYGDERDPEMRAFFDRIAPLNNASRITKPLFVVQGGNDPRVPRTEAEQMVAKVRENGSPVWYLMARDEGHGFRKKNNADFQFYATILFVRQFLLGQGGGPAAQ